MFTSFTYLILTYIILLKLMIIYDTDEFELLMPLLI